MRNDGTESTCEVWVEVPGHNQKVRRFQCRKCWNPYLSEATTDACYRSHAK